MIELADKEKKSIEKFKDKKLEWYNTEKIPSIINGNGFSLNFFVLDEKELYGYDFSSETIVHIFPNNYKLVEIYFSIGKLIFYLKHFLNIFFIYQFINALGKYSRKL